MTREGETLVWVLGASTGGIQAVCRFLSRVPVQRDLVFLYVQHGVEEQHRALLRAVERTTGWPASGVDYGDRLRGGRVLVPAPGERFDLDEDGTLGVIHDGGWRHPYRPNIDEVAEQVAGVYGPRTGLMVFTGMGSDACTGAAAVVAAGGRVWVQDPAECVASAMPLAVLAGQPEALCAPVDALAERFNEQISQWFAQVADPGVQS